MLLVYVAGVSKKARKENEPLLPDILFTPGALFRSTACQLACSISPPGKGSERKRVLRRLNLCVLCCFVVALLCLVRCQPQTQKKALGFLLLVYVIIVCFSLGLWAWKSTLGEYQCNIIVRAHIISNPCKNLQKLWHIRTHSFLSLNSISGTSPRPFFITTLTKRIGISVLTLQ